MSTMWLAIALIATTLLVVVGLQRIRRRRRQRDALTALPGRQEFQQRVDAALAGAQQHHDHVAVLLLDLNRFSEVNDAFGHRRGDELLLTVASHLRRCVRYGDALARFGDDEFGILLDRVLEASAAEDMARRVLERFSEPFAFEDGSVRVTAGIGIAVTTNALEETATDLLQRAEVALRSAKQDGVSGYRVCDDHAAEPGRSRARFEADLETALKDDQFIIHYQPVVALDSGAVLAVEALLRWQHPTAGLLAPAAFIAQAEQSQLMLPLGRWVLREACHALSRLQEHQPRLRMSINVSPRQLDHDTTFVEAVVAVLAETRIAPSDLILEVTEGALMREPEHCRYVLGKLREIGIHIALDDFGTGYSSLASLRDLPASVLKLDKRFIDNLGAGRDRDLIHWTAKLADLLEMTVIAEGIETPQQAVLLQSLGYVTGQGFYFCIPSPENVLAEYLGQHLPQPVPRIRLAGAGGDAFRSMPVREAIARHRPQALSG